MFVKPFYMRAVVFICAEDPQGQRRPRATAFCISLGGDPAHYLVTARHCIENAPDQFWIRANARSGMPVDISSSRSEWYVHDRADVAVLPQNVDPSWDELDLSAISTDEFVDANYRYSGPWRSPSPGVANPFETEGGWPVAIGEEIYFVGLFSEVAGRKRNLPIVRHGTISRMPEEEVRLQRDAYSEFDQFAYLVECKSWGGHSGSPAFWVWPGAMFIHREPFLIPPGGVQGMLGLVSHHYDVPVQAVVTGDIATEGSIRTPINAGIAVIRPAHYIRDLLMRSDVKEYRLQKKNGG